MAKKVDFPEPVTRPFHETIVDAIRRCCSTEEMLLCWFPLIKETTIPAGHDAIIAAIEAFFNFSGASKYGRDIAEVLKSIYGQKYARRPAPGKKK